MWQFTIGFLLGLIASWLGFLFKGQKQRHVAGAGKLTNPRVAPIAILEPIDAIELPEEPEKPSAAAEDSVVSRPVAEEEHPDESAVRTSIPNDLKEISGIGPKINGLLVEAGIVTFKQLANAEVSVLEEILEKAGPRFHLADPDDWAKQARELMK